MPGRGAHGIALRSFDIARRTWSIHWVSSSDGLVGEPVHGRFENGEGRFYGVDVDAGRPVKVSFLWSDHRPGLGPMVAGLLLRRRPHLGDQLDHAVHPHGARRLNPHLLSLASLFAVSVAACVVPGPNNFMLMRFGMRRGRGPALAAGFGTTLSCMVWCAGAVLGLAAVLTAAPLALQGAQGWRRALSGLVRGHALASGARGAHPPMTPDRAWAGGAPSGRASRST